MVCMGSHCRIPLSTPVGPACLFMFSRSSVQEDTMETGSYGRRGSPWEFNLRDVFRWCELMQREQGTCHPCDEGDPDFVWAPWRVVDTLYIQRMRTLSDREAISIRFMEAFPEASVKTGNASGPCIEPTFAWDGGIGTQPALRVSPEWVQVGQTVLKRGCWSEAGDRRDEGSSLEHPMPSWLRRPLQALAR